MGKGDAPRPIPDRVAFEDNWDKVFRSKPAPKSKAAMMRKMRKMRADSGLVQVNLWVTKEEKVKIDCLLSSERIL